MSEKDLMAQLYDRAAAEQRKYREALYAMPTKEALDHAFEYTAREDILMELEELELEPARARALLSSNTPLADIYGVFNNLESSRMEEIRSCVEDRADTLLTRQRELPVYTFPASYARENNELDLYRASYRANISCREAIDEAIRENYDGNRLNGKRAVQEVKEQFGFERMLHVLAVTVRQKEWDGRISRDNISWAKTVPVFEDKNAFGDDRNLELVLRSHPGIIDLFVSDARREYLLSQPLEKLDIEMEAARILSKFQALSEPNSPGGTHYMVEVSPDFMYRATSKDTARLAAMLPFQSLALSDNKDEHSVFAAITKDEDRSKPLRQGRPSARSKLKQFHYAPKPASPGKEKEPER